MVGLVRGGSPQVAEPVEVWVSDTATYNFNDNTVYSLANSDSQHSTGGQVVVRQDSQSALLHFLDSNANLFFQVARSDRFCVISATKNGLSVYQQKGAECTVVRLATGGYRIVVSDSEITDCQWNGEKCAIQSGLKMSFTLVSPEFKFDQLDDYYGRKPFQSTAQISGNKAVVTQTSISGVYYFNVTSSNGWCFIGAESNVYNWLPFSVVYSAKNAECKTTSIGYHQFEISATDKPRFDCVWNGVECR